MNNYYYNVMIEKFTSSFAQKRDMEHNFSPNMIEKYKALNKEIIGYAVELVKAGIDWEENGNSIVFYINNNDYRIEKSDMISAVGKECLQEVFPWVNAYIDSELTNEFDSLMKEAEEQQGIAKISQESRELISCVISPFATLMQRLVQNSNNNLECVEKYVGQIKTLENEKDQLKTACEQLNISYTEAVSSIDQITARMNTEIQDKDREIFELRQKIEELNQSHASEEEINAYLEKIDLLNKQIEALKNSYEAIVRQKTTVETELCDVKEKAREDNAKMQEIIDGLKSSSAEREAQKTLEISSLKQQISELETKNGSFQDLNEEILSLRNEREQLKAEKNRISGAKEDLERDKEQIKREKEDLESRNSTLENEKNDLIRKNNSLSQSINDVKTMNAKLRSDNETLTKQIQETGENDNRKDQEINEVRNELSSVRDTLTKQKEICDSLRVKCTELEKIAYEDTITNVMNANAFNRDSQSVNKDNTIILIASIGDLRSINYSFGRETGDKVIGIVADNLAQKYGRQRVYRLYGDNFVALIDRSTFSDGNEENDVNVIRDYMKGLCAQLQSEQIILKFGVASCGHFSCIEQAFACAEDIMKEHKYPEMYPNKQEQNSPAQPPREVMSVPSENPPEDNDDDDDVDFEAMYNNHINS